MRPPDLPQAHTRTLVHAGEPRFYKVFLPEGLPPRAPLVVMMHGATQSAELIRRSSGYAFERVAMREKFALVYPSSLDGRWGDLRVFEGSEALEPRDDSGFIVRMIDALITQHDLDRARVLLAGFSNGGHLAFRLSLERPETHAAIAVFAANLPVASRVRSVTDRGVAKPVLLVNGSEDPVNPDGGGIVGLNPGEDRGTVRSTLDTIAFFRARAGHTQPPIVDVIEPQEPDGTRVVRSRWAAKGLVEVELCHIEGGGHVVPQPHVRLNDVGRTTTALNGAEEAWAFFARTF